MAFAWILGLFSKKIPKVQGPKQEKKKDSEERKYSSIKRYIGLFHYILLFMPAL